MRDEIDSALDKALWDTLSDTPDSLLAARTKRQRILGLMLLALAVALIPFVAAPLASKNGIGALLLGSAAIVLLSFGGWLLDKASRTEIQSHRVHFSGVLRDALREVDNVLIQAKIRRRRFFGISMLLLAGFCVAVAATPFPGKQLLDALLWSGFAVTLVVVGTWQLLVATREARGASEMLAAALIRLAARRGKYLGPAED